ncbi:MAG: transporter substrate-binding domain-containing protein [Myxococcota bacterium]|nr:transporter substrate-binding domain-containing protein [Myxococcota bacterium]
MHRIRIRSLLPVLLWLILFGLGLGCANTTPSPDAKANNPATPVINRIEQSGILRVGMSGDQPPFNAKTRTGEIVGIEPDLANALAAGLGVRAEFVEMPFGELLGALEAGRVDIVLSQMTVTPQRNRRVAFTTPYFVTGKAILTGSEILAKAEKSEDLNIMGLRLSALAGSTSEDFIRKRLPSARLTTTADSDQAVKMVLDGTADAMVADLPICVISVLRNPRAGLVTVSTPFTFDPIGAALPAHDPLFLNLVENFMLNLEGSGLMEQLTQRWFNDPSWLEEMPDPAPRPAPTNTPVQ